MPEIEESKTESKPNALFDPEKMDELMGEWGKLSMDEMVRGHALADIEKRCLELCQSYIGGSWNEAKSTDDVTVKRISGGFTNQLYHVQLNDSVKRVKNPVYFDEPSDVAIKFYQEKHMKNYNQQDDERLNDMIILTIMGQKGYGPKIYGIFKDGFIQGYYKHEQFRAKHQEDPKLIRDLMCLLARINHLNVPIRKESNLLFEDMKDNIEFAYANCRVQEFADECNLTGLKEHHVLDEYKELMEQIKILNAPSVFCHNDFRGSNLLVTEDQKILACDLEYCGMGTRGFDFSSFAFEWGKKDLFDMSNQIPDNSVMEYLLKMYIEESDRIIPGYSSKPGNSLADHLKEAKIMMLANNLFFIALMMKQTESFVPAMEFDPKKQIEFVEMLYKFYLSYKETLIAEGIIKKLN